MGGMPLTLEHPRETDQLDPLRKRERGLPSSSVVHDISKGSVADAIPVPKGVKPYTRVLKYDKLIIMAGAKEIFVFPAGDYSRGLQAKEAVK